MSKRQIHEMDRWHYLQPREEEQCLAKICRKKTKQKKANDPVPRYE